MKNRPFIPKPLKRYSWTIWRKYTWVDLLILLIWTVCIGFMTLAIDVVIWQRVIIFISAMGFLSNNGYPI